MSQLRYRKKKNYKNQRGQMVVLSILTESINM
jgi:hypothetical protein